MRPKFEIYTPNRDDEHPHPFHMPGPPPPPPPLGAKTRRDPKGFKGLLREYQLFWGNTNSVLVFTWRDTKTQTKKLSILPIFNFHGALELLKTNFHTNFRFKRVLGFMYPWISDLLRDAAFTWRPRELSCRLKKKTYFRKFCYLNSSCIRKSITLRHHHHHHHRHQRLKELNELRIPPCKMQFTWKF